MSMDAKEIVPAFLLTILMGAQLHCSCCSSLLLRVKEAGMIQNKSSVKPGEGITKVKGWSSDLEFLLGEKVSEVAVDVDGGRICLKVDSNRVKGPRRLIIDKVRSSASPVAYLLRTDGRGCYELMLSKSYVDIQKAIDAEQGELDKIGMRNMMMEVDKNKTASVDIKKKEIQRENDGKGKTTVPHKVDWADLLKACGF